MGGCSFEEDCEFISARTIVLVGKTGNGKSATGNSILGMNVLTSKRSSSGVTVSSELQATKHEDGQMINVIDTPGLFDASLGFEFIAKEIVKCISMAPNGVDAFLVVVSTMRFSEEEHAAISSLQTLFGSKVYDYMIVVFTRGDELDDEDLALEDFLCDSPESLKETLSLCGNRYVLFDNKTKNESKRSDQVKKLLSLVNLLSIKNEGKTYTNEIFTEMKNQTRELKEQEVSLDDQRFMHIYELVESKLKETTLKLELQLAEEHAAQEVPAATDDSGPLNLDERFELLAMHIEGLSNRVDAELVKIGERLQDLEDSSAVAGIARSVMEANVHSAGLRAQRAEQDSEDALQRVADLERRIRSVAHFASVVFPPP